MLLFFLFHRYVYQSRAVKYLRRCEPEGLDVTAAAVAAANAFYGGVNKFVNIEGVMSSIVECQVVIGTLLPVAALCALIAVCLMKKCAGPMIWYAEEVEEVGVEVERILHMLFFWEKISTMHLLLFFYFFSANHQLNPTCS